VDSWRCLTFSPMFSGPWSPELVNTPVWGSLIIYSSGPAVERFFPLRCNLRSTCTDIRSLALVCEPGITVQYGVKHGKCGVDAVDGLRRPRPFSCLDRYHHMGRRQFALRLPDVSSSCKLIGVLRPAQGESTGD